jgi:hypothetical protein
VTRIVGGGLSERPMELVLKTSEQQCFVGSNPTASAIFPSESFGYPDIR